jgi:hypothetical protein
MSDITLLKKRLMQKTNEKYYWNVVQLYPQAEPMGDVLIGEHFPFVTDLMRKYGLERAESVSVTMPTPTTRVLSYAYHGQTVVFLFERVTRLLEA